MTASTSNRQWGSGDVAVVFFAGNGRSAEQCKADARLIAAAPELLEALQEMVKWHGKRAAYSDGFLPFEQQELEVQQAMRAIARATGEQQ